MRPGRAICGDGVVTPPEESCDGPNLNGATCQSLGYLGGGVLSCNPTTCTFDTIMCRMTTGMRPPVVPPPPIVPPPTRPPPGFEDAGIDDAGR